MSLAGDLSALILGNAVGCLLVLAVVAFAIYAVRRGWLGWAGLAIVGLLVATIAVPVASGIMQGWFGAFFTLLNDVWTYLLIIGTAVLLVFAWRITWGLQKRHRDAEPHGQTKVLVAIVFSLLLGFGGWYEFSRFEDTSLAGTHDTLVKNLNRTIGEGKYLDNLHTVNARPATIASLQVKLAGQNSTLNTLPPASPQYADMLANKTETWGALNQSRKDLADAQVALLTLTPNHLLWHEVLPMILSHEDDKAESIIVRSTSAATIMDVDVLGWTKGDSQPCTRDALGHCKDPFEAAPIQNTYIDLHGASVPFSEDGPRVFHNQREFNEQRQQHMAWLVYPGLTGLFLAPFAFVGGHILGKAFEASSSVGYKRYPGKAAGLFLLLTGGVGVFLVFLVQAVPGLTGFGLSPPLDFFGVFAIPFAAWVLRDLHTRSVEGQIAL